MNAEFFKLIIECQNEVNECGLEIAPHIDYTLNNRLSIRGRCIKVMSDTFEVQLSGRHFKEYFARGEYDTIKGIILHEMCHAMPNGFNHGTTWKAYADKLNKRFGYNISRLAEMDDVSSKIKGLTHIVYCRFCDEEFATSKKAHENINRYRCSKCKGELERK